jgi:hypothetical protein
MAWNALLGGNRWTPASMLRASVLGDLRGGASV